jgi:hypothetical protein
MPFGAAIPYACQNLQTDLVNFYQQNAPQFRTLGQTSFLRWLLSPQNTSGFERINVESIPGKKRGVAFRTETPFCYSLCNVANPCNDPDTQFIEVEDEQIVFDLTGPEFRHCDDQGRPVKLRFNEEELMKYCLDDDTTWIRNKIIRYLMRFEEALDKALAMIIETQVGTNHTGAAITDVPIFTTGTNFNPAMVALNPEAQWYIQHLFTEIGLDGQFGLIGGTIISKLAQYTKWAALNDAGVDMSKVDAMNPYLFYNRNFNEIFGERDMLLAAPGATQLVTWNKYKGEKRRSVTDLYTKATVTLPRTGLEVDFKYFYDYDCEVWVYEAFLHAELATVPPGGCAGIVGYDLSDVNGLIRIHDCGAQPLVPECVEAEPPAE